MQLRGPLRGIDWWGAPFQIFMILTATLAKPSAASVALPRVCLESPGLGHHLSQRRDGPFGMRKSMRSLSLKSVRLKLDPGYLNTEFFEWGNR
jgi:hypothetical protein